MVYQKALPVGPKFECHICNAKLQYASTLKKHIRTHKPPELECPRCSKKYHFQYQILEHLRACRGNVAGAETMGAGRCIKLEVELEDPLTSDLKRETEVDEIEFGDTCFLKEEVVCVAGLEDIKTTLGEVESCAGSVKLEIKHEIQDNSTGKSRTDCVICKRKFISRYDLRKHIRSYHGTKCPKCPAFLTTANSLRYHQNFHKGIRPYKCRIEGCEVAFSSPGNRKVHENSCRNDRMTCSCCGERFTYSLDLQNHVQVCFEENTTILDIANDTKEEIFSEDLSNTSTTYVKEQLIEDIEPQLKDESPVVSNNNNRKRRSTALPKGKSSSTPSNGKFECEICVASFQNKTSLRYHTYWHEGFTPYPCRNEGCSESFSHPQLRADHEQPCRGEVSTCPVCNVELKRKSLLRHHMRQFHKGVSLEKLEAGELDLEELQEQYRGVVEDEPIVELVAKTLEEFVDVELDDDGKEKLFKCRMCPAVLHNRKTFKYHANIHKRLKPYRCRVGEECQQAFHSPQTRNGHEEKCRGDRLACPLCDKVITGKKMLGRHMREHRKNNPQWEVEEAERCRKRKGSSEQPPSQVMCELCSKVFQTRPALKYHLNMHYGRKPYKCRNEGCEEAFFSPQIRVTHEQPCRKEVSVCPHCGAQLKRKDILKKHIDRYHGDKRVEDEPDAELMSSLIELDTGAYQELVSASKMLEEMVEPGSEQQSRALTTRAVETVSADDPRVVEVNLQLDDAIEVSVSHRKTKSRRKTIACQLCNAILQSKSTFEYHMNEHNGLKPYRCRNEGCNEAFPSPQKRLAHEEPCQGKVFPCEVCGAVLMRSYLLKKHMENCHSEGLTKRAIFKPNATVRLKRFLCKLCFAVFQTKEGFRLHMNGHTGTKPFECRASNCEECFVNPRQRILHEKGVHGDLSICPRCGIKVKKFALLAKHMAQCESMGAREDAMKWKMEVVDVAVEEDDIIEETVSEIASVASPEPEDADEQDENDTAEYLDEDLLSNHEEMDAEAVSDCPTSFTVPLENQDYTQLVNPTEQEVTALEVICENLPSSAEEPRTEDQLSEKDMVIVQEPSSSQETQEELQKLYHCRNKGCSTAFVDAQSRYAHEGQCRRQTVCKCEICDIELASKQLLKRHMAFKHPDHSADDSRKLGTDTSNDPSRCAELVCNLCQTAFSSKDGYRYHMNSHRGAEPYQCRGDGCDERFVNPTKRHTHEKQCHGDLYVCPDCGAKFKRVDTRKRHMLHGCHAGNKPVDSVYRTESTMMSDENMDGTVEFLHPEQDDAVNNAASSAKLLLPLDDKAMEEREPDLVQAQGGASKSFWCRLCPAVLHSIKTFKYHLNEHTGDKPYSCRNEGCTEAFASPQKRAVHEEPCRGETSTCPYCGIKMKRKAILAKHIAVYHKQLNAEPFQAKTDQDNNTPRTYLCELCSAVLKSAKTYQYHMNTHYGVTPFKCRNEGCEQAFVSPSARAVHEQPCRGEVVKCSICDAQLINSRSLQIHMSRLHPEELSREREDHQTTKNRRADPTLQQYYYESSLKPERKHVRQSFAVKHHYQHGKTREADECSDED